MRQPPPTPTTTPPGPAQGTQEGNTTLSQVRGRATETQIIHQIYTGLSLLGYIVMRTGQRRADKAGQDKGCPDLFVTRPNWKTWKGLEVKTACGKVRFEQQVYANMGILTIVRTWEEALKAVQEVYE